MGWSTPPPPPVPPSVKSQFYFNSDKEVVTEGFFLSSFFARKICNHRPQNRKTNILPLSYGSLSPLPSPSPPPHPPNNHSWGDWVRFTSTGGGDTPYNGVYGEAPPERGIGKSIIWVRERAKELTDDFYGFIKLKKCSIFVMDSYLKDSAFTAAKRMQSVLSKVWERGTICKLKVTRKGHRKKRHIKGKGLDLGAVPPRINICWVPAPLPLLGPLPRKNFIRYKSGY